MNISVGARSSNLSKVQVQEVFTEIQKKHPEIVFEPVYFQTVGDKDLKTSLRDLPQNDFFTKEIDDALLDKKIRIAIHSAKDLPLTLRDGVHVIAITQGLDSRDALVLQQNLSLETVPAGARIATSSFKRDAAIQALLPQAKCVDIRGTIEMRLDAVFSGKIEGVVVAEAALLRLGLSHLRRIYLSHPTAPLQGKLAIVCRSDDDEMKKLFSSIDSRKKILYTGIDVPPGTNYIHYPLIQTAKLPIQRKEFLQFDSCTYIIITSKASAKYFHELSSFFQINAKKKQFVVVGKKTAQTLLKLGYTHLIVSENESSEGVIATIQKHIQKPSSFFWPHSKKSREVIASFFKDSNHTLIEYVLYDTLFQKPEKNLHEIAFDEIFFSSPSTVDAYFTFFGTPSKPTSCQGEVTERYLRARIEESCYTI